MLWVRVCTVLGMLLASVAVDAGQQVVRSGIYQNEPKIFEDAQGRPSGFFADLLDAIAREENWKLEYHACAWEVCLQKLEAGDIDIMPDVAYSAERALRFGLGREVVLSSWSVVYVRQGEAIPSLSELQGRRLAVVRDSIQYQVIMRRLNALGVAVHVVEKETFAQVFRALQQGQADAGLVNTYFGRRHAARFGLKKTAILVKPSLLVFAAAPNPRGESLLQVLDHHIKEYKTDKSSVYYRALQRWSAPEKEKDQNAQWLVGLLMVVVVGSIVFIALLRKRVRQKARELCETSEHVEHLTNHDLLTGLANRKLFFERLDQIILAQTDSESAQIAILYVDLDQFKYVNDSFGHDIGDRVLQEVAGRLRLTVPESLVLARLGGDEFAVVIKTMAEPETTMHCVQKLGRAFEKSIVIDAQRFAFTISVGISLFPQDGADSHTLLRNADTALSKAKDQGRGSFQYYVEEMTRLAVARTRLESEMRWALQKVQQFEVHYQPQIQLQSGTLVGFEALARWHHPELGWVSPAKFIPVAEETGMIDVLGAWVLKTACAQLVEWHSQGFENIIMAVNISARQLHEGRLLRMVDKVLQETGCPADHLELELTESLVMTQTENAISSMQQLKQLGVELSIDDFGTGYSSLAYLKQLPISKLKIDRSFVQRLPDDENDKAIVRAVIAMAQALHLQVLAEGVETSAQEELLRDEQCDMVQGFYYAAGLDPAKASAYLRRFQ